MSDDFKRTEISTPGAAIKELKIELPRSLKDAISESLDRGRLAAKAEREATRPGWQHFFRRKLG